MGVAEVLLDLADVHTVQEQMCREAVAKRVNRDRLVEACRLRCASHRLLDDRLVEMVTSTMPERGSVNLIDCDYANGVS